ncbi:MAG: hypothetical protein ACFE9R_10760 [Candidatus Hermodarchaeota archaeon]
MESDINNLNNSLITCPVCGYSFKLDLKLRRKEIECPMCGYIFKSPNLRLNSTDLG